MTARSGLAAASLLALTLLASAPDRDGPSAAPRGEGRAGRAWKLDLSADTLGLPPSHSVIGGGVWSVGADSTVAGGRVLRQTDAEEGIGHRSLRMKRPTLSDVEASVRFRILSGEIDPSAGLMFQVDPKGKNGYLARVSGREGQLIVHYLLNGRRRDIRSTAIEPPEPGAWHTLSVRRVGSVIRVSYDGAQRLFVRDERFRAGTVGLWTEDDTVAEFVELTAAVP